MADSLNRVVSPVGDRLQKQKDAIARFEHREAMIKRALAMYDDGMTGRATLGTIREILAGAWDDLVHTG